MDCCTICGQHHDTTGCPQPVITVVGYGGRDYQPTLQQGWECPKCHAVMGPFQPSCIHCIPVVVTLSGKAPA